MASQTKPSTATKSAPKRSTGRTAKSTASAPKSATKSATSAKPKGKTNGAKSAPKNAPKTTAAKSTTAKPSTSTVGRVAIADLQPVAQRATAIQTRLSTGKRGAVSTVMVKRTMDALAKPSADVRTALVDAGLASAKSGKLNAADIIGLSKSKLAKLRVDGRKLTLDADAAKRLRVFSSAAFGAHDTKNKLRGAKLVSVLAAIAEQQ